MKYLMQLPNRQTAIAASSQPNLPKLLYDICKRLDILENQMNNFKRSQKTQQMEISENKENIQDIQEMGESFEAIISHYRYLKDRNADLEALERFHYPED